MKNKLNVLLPTILTCSQARVYTTVEGGPTFQIVFDSSKNKFKYTITSPQNQDLWLVYNQAGKSTNTDITQFISGEGGSIRDMNGNIFANYIDG